MGDAGWPGPRSSGLGCMERWRALGQVCRRCCHLPACNSGSVQLPASTSLCLKVFSSGQSPTCPLHPRTSSRALSEGSWYIDIPASSYKGRWGNSEASSTLPPTAPQQGTLQLSSENHTTRSPSLSHLTIPLLSFPGFIFQINIFKISF